MCSLISEARLRSSSHSGNGVRLAVALLAQIPQPAVVKRQCAFVGDEVRRRLGVIDRLHARAPLRTCAMWMKRDVKPEALGAAFLVHQARHVRRNDVLGARAQVIV